MAAATAVWAAIDVDRARAIARRVHAADREGDGAPLLGHISRVAGRTPVEARAVAWLHQALESPMVTEHELLGCGLNEDELRALRLLTRSTHAHSAQVYLAYLELIALAAGPSGHLARTVKMADLEDRCRHPPARAGGWSPPYDLALRRLEAAEGRAPYGHG